MKQRLIKTHLLVDDPFGQRKWRTSPLYVLLVDEDDAVKRLEAGEKIFSVHPSNKHYGEMNCRKALKSAKEIHEMYSYGCLCGVKMPKNRLLDEEYSVLNVLATRSGEDCWFRLIKKGGKDMVRDLESDEHPFMSLSTALPIFAEGLLSLETYRLSKEDENVAECLFDRFNIKLR